MFQPVSSKVSFPELEDRTLQLWRDRDVFRRTWSEREGKPLFMLYEGPPTTNGTPGMHHVLARVFKDVIPRYKTMRGYRPFRKGGWDTHGLPVELEVEKELGFTTKGEIEEYGIDRFNALCRESVQRYKGEWEDLTERVGFWIDLDDPYVTFHNGYIQTGWWIIKELWDRGLVYLGYRVTPHCPRCVTSLSSHEVSLGYKDDTPDPSIYVRFPLADEQDEAADAARRMGWSEAGWDGPVPSAVAWTTTPWTLTANMALAVAPNADYALLRSPDGGERLLLARARVEEVLGEGWTEEASFKGGELQGLRYSPPFANATEHEGAPFHHRVLPADYVGVDDGTGIVHTAPAYGAEDYDLGRTFGLPTYHSVDMQGALAEGYPGGGLFVKDADPLITADLEQRGLLYRGGTMLHTYPFCWRCDTPLLYYAKPSWYIRTTAHKDEMVAINKEINWYPGHYQEGRFGDWLRNNVDWAISRERYWGTPIPIWRCVRCGQDECIGDLDALRERATPETRSALDEDGLDLHRPYIDTVVVTCQSCGGEARRTPEVLDCWFDSGAMPYAQFHFPKGSPELFSDGRFPADYICEGVRPDARVVLQPARPLGPAAQRAQLPQRHLPGPHPGRPGREDEQDQGQHRGAVGRHQRPRCRRRAVVPADGGASGQLQAVLTGPGGGVRPPLPADPLEHLQLLHHLRAAGRLRPDGGGAARAGGGAGPVGAVGAEPARRRRDGGDGRLQPHGRGPQDRGLRGGALDVVRATQPPPLLEERE